MLIYLYSLSSLAISQLLFLALLYLLFFRRNIGALLPLLLCICLFGMVVRLTTLVIDFAPFWLTYSSQRLTQAVPAVMWVLAYKLFADNQRVPKRVWILLVSYQLVLAILPFITVSGDTIPTWINRLAYVFMFAIGLHIVAMALEGRANDLILKRRRLRVPFALGVGVICASLFGAVFFVSILGLVGSNLSRLAYIICIGSIFVFALTVNLVLVSLFANTPQFDQLINWDSNNQILPAPSQPSSNPRTVKRIIELMEVEKLYQDPELTIIKLAERISYKEHRLRKVINHEMGYRNFNQFLNNYRIKEACRLLLNEDNPDFSISLISLEVGYASLSSFNKAFKDITGVTPSAFRHNPNLNYPESLENAV